MLAQIFSEPALNSFAALPWLADVSVSRHWPDGVVVRITEHRPVALWGEDGVLAVGIEAGLLVGIGLSLALYLWRTSQPHMAVIGRVPGTEHFRNVCRHVVETDR